MAEEHDQHVQDYRGDAVTAANFLSVLAGQEPAVIGSSGRTIKSGPNDRVFVFYADHGAPGEHCMCIKYVSDIVALDHMQQFSYSTGIVKWIGMHWTSNGSCTLREQASVKQTHKEARCLTPLTCKLTNVKHCLQHTLECALTCQQV